VGSQGDIARLEISRLVNPIAFSKETPPCSGTARVLSNGFEKDPTVEHDAVLRLNTMQC
jgi:hypothetical protein